MCEGECVRGDGEQCGREMVSSVGEMVSSVREMVSSVRECEGDEEMMSSV